MKPETYTVTHGWTDRTGKFWVYLEGLARPFLSQEAWPEGTAVRIENGRAVK